MFIENYYSDKKIEKEVLQLPRSLNYWMETLFEKCVRMFEWRGLPKSIPQKEIEQRLILDGYCGMVNDTRAGLIVASGGLSGVTPYCDEFKNFTYAAPTCAGGTTELGKNAVLIENTSLRNPLFPMILRYADLMAHAEISLKMALINGMKAILTQLLLLPIFLKVIYILIMNLSIIFQVKIEKWLSFSKATLYILK